MAKILHISQRYVPAVGGAELYVQTLAEHQVEQGHQVDVWTTDALEADALWHPQRKKVEKESEVINGVNVRRFKISPLLLNNLFINKGLRYVLFHAPSWFLQCFGSPPMIPGMYMELLKKDLPKYDIIHVCAMPYNSIFYVGMKLAEKTGAKFYMTPFQHVNVTGKYVNEDKYYHPRVLPFFNRADKVFVQTDSERNELSKFFNKYQNIKSTSSLVAQGFRSNLKTKDNTPFVLKMLANIFVFLISIFVIPFDFIVSLFKRTYLIKKIDDSKMVKVGLGVFPERLMGGDKGRFISKYDIDISTPIIFYVGAKVLVKGVKGLVDAATILVNKGLKFKLVLGGVSTIEFEKMWEQVPQNVKDSTILINNLSDEEKLDLYDAGDVFVMVSKSESFGIVYLESWLYEKPVIGCNIDAVKEIISDGVDGYLVDFDDSETISKHLEELLSSAHKRVEMGRAGKKKTLSTYTWKEKFKILDEYFK